MKKDSNLTNLIFPAVIGGIIGAALAFILQIIFSNSVYKNPDVYGNIADWVSGIGTIAAIIISIKITKNQIAADKKKDQENFFLQQDYLVMDNIQEKLLSNHIFIENTKYVLEATFIPPTDDDRKEFWTEFIRDYHNKYRTLVDNNNYIINKIHEYGDVNPLIKDIMENELKENSRVAERLRHENIKMDNYLVSQGSKKYRTDIYGVPDEYKIIPILNEYSKTYSDMMEKIKAIKFKFRKRL
ncbi:hypothetical protein IRM63_06095 [Leuconostoc citreum]|uniref:hypothetical protein n=1 Tax=Leuconostoc citreum TaxID=33964 RepID=UPI001889A090|nr:hypothetical protein [Leuconostoc citreum]QOY97068.1 hypothetical protein IRM63_06095 [Leuconostoc citreum]